MMPIIVIVLAFLEGCSNPSLPAPRIELADLGHRILDVLCSDPCYPADLGASNNAYCISSFDGAYGEELRQRARLVELGRVHYDAEAAAACVAAVVCQNFVQYTRFYESTSAYRVPVPDDATLPEACGRIFTGTLVTGSACDDDAECAVGRCWGDVTPTCVEPAELGAACGTSLPCAAGAICYQGKCTANVDLAAGATCSWTDSVADINDLWWTTKWCTLGRTCMSPPNTVGTCQPLLVPGQPCQYDEQCDSPCIAGTCQATQWTLGVQCGGGNCNLDQYCNDAGICAPWRNPGDPCATGEQCLGSVCLSATHACSLDNPCGPSCQAAQCREDGTCLAARIGDHCAVDADCTTLPHVRARLHCVDGECHRLDNPAQSWQ